MAKIAPKKPAVVEILRTLALFLVSVGAAAEPLRVLLLAVAVGMPLGAAVLLERPV